MAAPHPDSPLRILNILAEAYPEAHCALHYRNPYELLVATILSAQCTDLRVNQVTPELFRNYPDIGALAAAELPELEQRIRATGFFRNKARHLKQCAERIRDDFHGEVPCTLEQLVALPGIGRKTANVVLGNAFGIPGMVVDTHVKRLAFRLGWSRHQDPERIEKDLCALFPSSVWTQAGHILIAHGRRLCKAPTPICSSCPAVAVCPKNGVKRSR
ncbi:MAG: endonuclease III [Deltaproteobacteria bacterium]|nr:endonuclease III [Deltaproteobacteria bacterium]